MAIYMSPQARVEPKFARDLLEALDPKVAMKVAAAGSDVAMVIDRSGFIRDLALSNTDMVADGFESWLDQRWTDTVSPDSRPKIEEMLRDAANDAGPRWREINYRTSGGEAVAVRYIAINAGDDGRVIAIGRDNRAIGQLQQRLVQAQQAVEHDYRRLREAESRYRLLFQLASEAVIVLDATSRKILEANPAADRLIGGGDASLIGREFSSAFEEASRDAAISLLAVAHGGPNLTAQATLRHGGRAFNVAASLFRQDRSSLFLVRLASLDTDLVRAPDSAERLLTVLERIPDAFVVTDESMKIIALNTAFLDLSRIASNQQAMGLQLESVLGRPDMDRNVLVSSLRQHGSLKNFATLLRTRLGEMEEVEVSAVHVATGEQPCFGFSIRSAARGMVARPRLAGDLPRSVEQLSQLVGRVSLKELVRETTELVERLCIEAALELTGNNRASAAEALGVSRQSLYSKLHRYGMGDLTTED